MMRMRSILGKRRYRRIATVVLVLVVGMGIAFGWMRFRDRKAWPEPLADVRLEALSSPLDQHAPNAWTLLSGLVPVGEPYTPPDPEFLAELRRFEALGFGTEESGFPLLEQRLASEASSLEVWRKAAALETSWARVDDIETQVPLLLRLIEIGRFSAYPTGRFLQQGDWDAAVESWLDTLRIAGHVTRGQGTLGLFVSLHLTLGVSREILLACEEYPISGEAEQRLLSGLREAEGGITSLAEALRNDRAMAHRALASLHTPRQRSMPREVAKRHPPVLALRIARMLGSSPERSAAHLDAVCSHAIARADQPYSRDGLFAGLPRWCTRGGRPPWTRDPLGALAASLFVRNTAASVAFPPNRLAELRAARIALALRAARESHPEGLWPASLDELLDAGLDAEALEDPFSPEGRRFVYKPSEDQWVFYSLGVDQQDHGGVNDWLMSESPREADLVYTSDERGRRRRLWERQVAAGSPVAEGAGRSP